MGEEVHILTGFEGTKCTDGTVDGAVNDDLVARGGKGGLLDGCNHLPHIETADLLHLEGCTVQIAELVPELV